MKQILYIVLIGSILFLTGCSSYNQVLKSDDYGAKFDLANELYDGGDEERSIGLYEQVYQRMPKTAEGEVSYFRIGKAYYVSGDVYMAGYYLNVFATRFADSPKAEEALFLSAMCAVSESPQPSLDQEATEIAISDLQQFIDRFPNSILLDSSNHMIDRLRFKLENKDYDGVKLYNRTENYRAAVSASITFMKTFPMSQFNEEVSYILVENSYYLAKNSVKSKKLERMDNTIERYRIFAIEFPDSKYLKIASKYLDLIGGEKKIFVEASK